MLACLLRPCSGHAGRDHERDVGRSGPIGRSEPSPSAEDCERRDAAGSYGGHVAVFPDDAGVVHWLVRHGANACHVLRDGRSAVHLAAERVRWHIARCRVAKHAVYLHHVPLG
jgi:hypothetical protein